MRENLCPPLKGARDLMAKDMEKTDVLNSLSSVFTGNTWLHQSQVPETSEKVWTREDLPSVEDYQIRGMQVHGAWWEVPTSTGWADWCHCEATHDYLWKVIVTRGCSWALEESKRHSHFQERQEEPQELRAGHPQLDPRDGDGETNPGNHFQA